MQRLVNILIMNMCSHSVIFFPTPHNFLMLLTGFLLGARPFRRDKYESTLQTTARRCDVWCGRARTRHSIDRRVVNYLLEVSSRSFCPRPNVPRIAIFYLATCTICQPLIPRIFHAPPELSLSSLLFEAFLSVLIEELVPVPLVAVSIKTIHHFLSPSELTGSSQTWAMAYLSACLYKLSKLAQIGRS